MKCGYCGNELPDHVKFCNQCGRKQQSSESVYLSMMKRQKWMKRILFGLCILTVIVIVVGYFMYPLKKDLDAMTGFYGSPWGAQPSEISGITKVVSGGKYDTYLINRDTSAFTGGVVPDKTVLYFAGTRGLRSVIMNISKGQEVKQYLIKKYGEPQRMPSSQTYAESLVWMVSEKNALHLGVYSSQLRAKAKGQTYPEAALTIYDRSDQRTF